MSDLAIYHATFHDGGVEIVYAEERDISDRVMQQRTIAVPLDVAGEDLMEALESLQQVVDNGQSYLINQERTKSKDLFTSMKGPRAEA